MQGAVETEPDMAKEEQSGGVTHIQTVALLVAITIGVSIFIVPMAWLGIEDFWCGFLFLLYWSGVEHMDNKRIVPVCVGGLVGLGIAAMFAILPDVLGPAWGWSIALVVVVAAVYCLIQGWLGTFINTATMLFLTVGGAPEMLHYATFYEGAIALVVAAVYFSAVANLAMYLINRSKTAS